MMLSTAEARNYLVHALGLATDTLPPGSAGVRELLGRRRCIQLDPLDKVGTNVDLVAMARIDGLRRGQADAALLPGTAFEHYAKERCLLPLERFGVYRMRASELEGWRCTKRMSRVDPEVLDAVEEEVRSNGPIAISALSGRGTVKPLDWSGWKGTAKQATMAAQVLILQCRLVVVRRERRGKAVDVPDRAVPSPTAREGFAREVLLDRVDAMGLLPLRSGVWWGELQHVKKTLPQELVKSGVLEEVGIEGTRTRYLARAGFREHPWASPDDRMRILGPLEPLLWDRGLVKHVFGFEYLWEVYKPAAKRRWGYYVTPLLHRGELVGRFEGHVENDELVVDTVWEEDGVSFDQAAWGAAIERHSAAMPRFVPRSA